MLKESKMKVTVYETGYKYEDEEIPTPRPFYLYMIDDGKTYDFVLAVEDIAYASHMFGLLKSDNTKETALAVAEANLEQYTGYYKNELLLHEWACEHDDFILENYFSL